MFEWSKVTIMMKVIYFIIFRSAITTPFIATALISSLGSVFVSTGLHFVFRKINDYKKMREVELAFKDFQVITSNLTWDNEELQHCVLDAVYYKELNLKAQYLPAVKVIESKLNEIIEGTDKYRDGTIVKQFNSEDDKLRSLVTKDVKDEGLEEWVEVSVDSNKDDEDLPIPPVF